MKNVKNWLWLLLAVLVCAALLVACNDSTEEPPEVDPCAAGHTYGTAVTVKEPTCTAQGEGKQTCSVCGDEKSTDVLPLGHTAGNWVIDVAAKCEAEGSRHRDCTVCGARLEEATLSAKGHTEGTWEITTPAGCESTGVQSVSCTVCDKVLSTSSVPAKGHGEVKYVVTLEPTCTTTGRKQQQCVDCGKGVKQPVSIPALGHGETEWRVKDAASCTEDGTEGKFCFVCEKFTGESRVIEAKGHVDGEWIIDERGSCTEDELSHQVCAVCGETIDHNIVVAEGHKNGEWDIIIQVTCTTDGYEILRCSVCEAALDERRPTAGGHVPGEVQVTTPAGCETEGAGDRFCLGCGCFYDSQIIPPTGHTKVWSTVEEPACEKDGLKVASCSVCGNENVESERIPATGHTEGEWVLVTAPKCVTYGESVQRCTVCQKQIATRAEEPTGHGAGTWGEHASDPSMMTLRCSVCLGVARHEARERVVRPIGSATTTLDLSGYRIVYPAGSSAAFEARVRVLAQRLSELTGKTVTAVADTTAKGAKDIVIGRTARAESETALSSITGHGFTIQYVGGSLVITGSTNLIALMGVDYFMNTYLSGESTTIQMPTKAVSDKYVTVTVADRNGSAYVPVYDKDVDTSTSTSNPDTYYGVIELDGISMSGYDYEYDMATYIASLLGSYSGNTSLAAKADNAAATAGEILVGRPDRAEVVEALSRLEGHEYGVFVIDGRVVITSWSKVGLHQLQRDFFDDAIDENGNIVLPAHYEMIAEASDRWLTDIPLPDDVPLHTTAEDGDGAFQYLFMGGNTVQKSHFDAYCAKLTAAGYEVLTQSNAEGSYFTTFVNSARTEMIHVAYNAFAHKANSGHSYTDPAIRVTTARVNGAYVSAVFPSSSSSYGVLTFEPGMNETICYGGSASGYSYFNTTYKNNIKSKGYTILVDSLVQGNYFFVAKNKATGAVLRAAYREENFKRDGTALGAGIVVSFRAPGVFNLPTAELLNPDQDYVKVTNSKIVAIDLSAIAQTYTDPTTGEEKTLSGSYGTGYVILLEDGRFVIIDGGAADGGMSNGTVPWAQVNNFWSIICTLHREVWGSDPTPQNPARIAAWIITHDHGDHMNVFWDFAHRYGGGNGASTLGAYATVDYLIANVPDRSMLYNTGESGVTLRWQMKKISDYFKDGFTYIKAQTGQHYYIADLEIETLFTHGDHVPQRIVTHNDVSTIQRLIFHASENGVEKNSATFLSTGDAYRWGGRWLIAMYGNYLKTDMVSVSHHGGPGFTAEVYDYVAPTAVWWSMVKTSAHGGYSTSSNWYSKVDQHLLYDVDSVKYVYVADDYHLTLELKPSGPDYGGIKDLKTGKTISYYSVSGASLKSTAGWNTYYYARRNMRNAQPCAIKKT